MTNLRPVKMTYSILSLCLIGVGLLLFINPLLQEDIAYRLCGIILVVFGVVKITGYFSKDIFQLAFQFDFALGCILCIIGIVFIFRTEWKLSLVSVTMGIFMLADALFRIQTAIDARNFGINKWQLLLLTSIIVAISGLLLLLMPFESRTFVMRMLGLNLCIDGILNFITVQSTVKEIRRKREW